MVNLMLRPAALQPTGLVYRRTNVGEFGGNSPGKGCGATVEPADPSACTFWCAVAMGAILKGSPVESVSRTESWTDFRYPSLDTIWFESMDRQYSWILPPQLAVELRNAVLCQVTVVTTLV